MPNIPESELLQMSERAAMIRETITTRGWTEIIKPALINRREGLIKTLLAKRYENLNEITYYQQSANAIEAILSLIESTLADGEDADNQLNAAILKKQNTEAEQIYES